MDGRFHVPGVGDIILVDAKDNPASKRVAAGIVRPNATRGRVLVQIGEKCLVLEPARTMEEFMVNETKKAI